MKYKLLSHKEVELLEEYIDDMEIEEKNQWTFSKWFYDIWWFTDIFLSHWKVDKKTKEVIETPQLHYELWDSFGSQHDTCVIVPRDHAKSTSAKEYLIWNICYQQDPSILLIMSEWLWVATIWMIREEFEINKDIKKVYGNMVPWAAREEKGKSWSQRKLKFLNWVELFTLVKGSKSKRWNRPTLILVDDPQENEDVKNKRIADEFESNFFTSIYNMLDDTWRCIVLWTVIWPNCFVEKIRQNPRWFNVIQYTAINNIKIKFLEENKIYKLHWNIFKWDWKKHIIWWNPLWPEKWSIEALDRRYKKLLWKCWKDDDKFFQEYMNEALLLWWRTFYNKTLLRKIKPIKPIRKDSVFPDLEIYWEPEFNCLIWWDVAEWLIDWDFSTIKVRSRKDYRLLASYRWHIHPFDLPKVYKRLFELWYIWRIWIERNNHWLTVLKWILEDKEHQVYSSYLYFEKVLDKITQKYSDKPWWLTSGKSRPLMLDKHNKLFEEWNLDINEEQKNEMQTFYLNEKWKPEALSPFHDDEIIADSICLQMEDFPIYKWIKL